MPDLQLTEDQQHLRDLARTVAAKSVAPRVEHADRFADGHLSVEEFRAMVSEVHSAGITTLLLPEEYHGAGLGAFDNALVHEEFGAVDAGVAGALNLSMTVPGMIVAAGTDEQKQRYFGLMADQPDFLIAGALNEPDVAGSDMFDPAPDPSRGTRTKARRDGDSWVIDGRKAAWVTNAGVASTYVVFARTDASVPGPLGTSAFWVPADTPGVHVGKRSQLLGLRSAFHAEVALDGVRVPAHDLIGPQGGGLALMGSSTAPMVIGLAASFVGLARTAYERAFAHAHAHRSWGKPLAEHQAVALMLADAWTEVRRARLAVWDAALALDAAAVTGPTPELGALLPAAKQHAVEAAIANAERAVKVLGATGVAVGGGAEKLLRDAWTGWSCDFTGDLLRLSTAAGLSQGNIASA